MTNRQRRRQTRHRTFGWQAELASPPRHNESVRIRKKLAQMNRYLLDVPTAFRRTTAAFEALVAAAARAVRQIEEGRQVP